MKRYVLSASFNKMTTSIPISARDDEMAKVLAMQKVAANSAADKRYAVGAITLKDSEDNVVWDVDEEEQEK